MDRGNLLSIFRLDYTNDPAFLGKLRLRAAPKKIVVSDGIACVAESQNGFEVIDVSDSASPKRISGSSGISVDDLALRDGLLFTISDGIGLSIFDLGLGVPPSLRLSEPAVLPSGAFQFHIEAAGTNTFFIQRSDGLSSWTDWQSVTPETPSFDVTDTNPFPAKNFYRIRMIP